MSTTATQRLERAVHGDADALTALLREFGPPIRRELSISDKWRAGLDAADVMQVTYLEVFLRIGQLKTCEPGVFAAWLKRIAENNLRDAIRQLKRLKRPDPRRRVDPASYEKSQIALLEQLDCSATSPSRQAAARESLAMLTQAMERLPETYQKVVRLYDLECQPPRQVAEALGRSVGAVHMLRARAHDRLRELLGSASKFFSDSP